MSISNMSISKLAVLLAVIAAACLGAAAAHATSLRTWVSNTGSDTNPCSITQPCLTFQGAINNTTSGGEINCLNPGGFSPVTISISVTIDCEDVSYGAIEVGAGTSAINVNTAGIVVNLIGLDINGENATGGIGVNITAGATVNIRNCEIYGFLFSGSGTNGMGILFEPGVVGGSGGGLVVDNVLLANNTEGILESSTNSVVANMTVRNSNINNNGAAGIWVLQNGGPHAGASIEQTTLAFNGNAFPTLPGSGLLVLGSGAVAVIGGSNVVNNVQGVFTGSGGTIYSFKNNRIGGNSTDGTPLTAYPGGPLN